MADFPNVLDFAAPLGPANGAPSNSFNILDFVTPTDLDPLLAEAVLVLRASAVSGYVAEDPWPNEGTAGSSADGLVDGFASTDQTNFTPTHDPSYSTGAAFVIAGTSHPALLSQYGFRVDSPAIGDLPDVGARTVFADYTPLSVNPAEGAKVWWKYTADSLPNSGAGHVGELVPGQGTTVATFDGSTFLGNITTIASGRQQIAMRFDRTTVDWSVFYNDVDLGAPTVGTMAGLGSVDSAADLLIAAGNAVHNIVVWNRALTDTEITVDLPAALEIP